MRKRIKGYFRQVHPTAERDALLALLREVANGLDYDDDAGARVFIARDTWDAIQKAVTK